MLTLITAKKKRDNEQAKIDQRKKDNEMVLKKYKLKG